MQRTGSAPPQSHRQAKHQRRCCKIQQPAALEGSVRLRTAGTGQRVAPRLLQRLCQRRQRRPAKATLTRSLLPRYGGQLCTWQHLVPGMD